MNHTEKRTKNDKLEPAQICPTCGQPFNRWAAFTVQELWLILLAHKSDTTCSLAYEAKQELIRRNEAAK